MSTDWDRLDRNDWANNFMRAMAKDWDGYVKIWFNDFMNDGGPNLWTEGMTELFPFMVEVLDEVS